MFRAFPVLICEWFAFTICSASKSDIVPHWYHALHAHSGECVSVDGRIILGARLCTGLILVCCLFPPHHKMATAAAKS